MKGIIISTSIAFILGIVLYVLDKFFNQKKKKDIIVVLADMEAVLEWKKLCKRML